MRSIKLSILAAAVVTVGFTTVKAQTADEIIQKHIDAIGGDAALSKIKSIKKIGSMSVQGMDIPTSTTLVADKGMRTEFTIMGMDCYVIITPKEGWMYMPVQPGMDKVTALPADQVKMASSRLNIKTALLADKSQIAKSEKVGMDTINNEACYKIKVTDKDNNEQTAYISTKTYYMVRTEAKIKVKDEDQEIAQSFSNFVKQPEGIVLAMTENNPMMEGDIVYKSVEINKPVSDDAFKPSEPKK